MSAFKDMVKADIDSVFLNCDEFADTHEWNDGKGKSYTIKAVVDDDILIKQYSSEFEMLEKGSHMIFASAEGFHKQPKAGDAVYFDKNLYTVDEVDEDMGMLAIFLSRGKG